MSNLLKSSFLIGLTIILIQNLSGYFINQLSPIQSQDATDQEKLVKDLLVFVGLATLAVALAWIMGVQAKQSGSLLNPERLQKSTKQFLEGCKADIESRLRSIFHDVWLNPDMEEQPYQVGNALVPNRVVQISGKSSEKLDLQTTILEVFERPEAEVIDFYIGNC
jgi:hypothetical protein